MTQSVLAQSAASSPPATIAGTVVGSGDQSGLPYASVAVVDPSAGPGALPLHERFADSAGAFRLGPLTPGTYRLRAREIGFAPADTTVTIAAGSVTLRLALVQVPHILPRVVVAARKSPACVRPGLADTSSSPELATVFRALMTNVDRFRLLRRVYPFRYAVERRRSQVTREQERVGTVDTIAIDSRSWKSYAPGHLFSFFQNGTGIGESVYIPSVQDLGDSAFLATHCFQYAGAETVDGDSAVRIDFQPERSLGHPDFGGSIYLDAVRGFVRRAVFRLTHGERVYPAILQLIVTTTFREIAPNVQVFDSLNSDQWIEPHGTVRDLETERFLAYQFERGAPGALSANRGGD